MERLFLTKGLPVECRPRIPWQRNLVRTLDRMLSAHELARLCERLGLLSEAQAIIETIRSSPPARRVRSAAGNVAVRYPSRQMGLTIQAESHRVEVAGSSEW